MNEWKWFFVNLIRLPSFAIVFRNSLHRLRAVIWFCCISKGISFPLCINKCIYFYCFMISVQIGRDTMRFAFTFFSIHNESLCVKLTFHSENVSVAKIQTFRFCIEWQSYAFKLMKYWSIIKYRFHWSAQIPK